MLNYWLFTVVDAKIGSSRIDALDLFGTRVRRLYWLLNPRNPHFRKIRKEDKVVLYVGGKKQRVFAGCCVLSTNPKRLLPEIKRYVIEDPEDRFNYFVNLKEVDVFDRPKQVIPLLKSLSFVRDERNWGRYFQGGIIRIGNSDYNVITEKRSGI